jgi:hypothetical protein
MKIVLKAFLGYRERVMAHQNRSFRLEDIMVEQEKLLV